MTVVKGLAHPGGEKLWLAGRVTARPLIAPATPADAGEILTVQRAAYLAEAQRYADPFLPPLTETLDEVRTALSGPQTVLTARLRNRLVGSVRVHVDGDIAYVGRLAVAPDQQGRGIGGRLLRAVETVAGARVSRFTLCTGADSAGSLRLYQRYGYRLVGHDRDPNGVPMVLLEKTVPSRC